MRPVVWLALALLACDAQPPTAVDEAGLAAAFQALHAPIYALYALGPDRDALHDHLSQRFFGDALTREYVEHWRTLVRMAQEDTGITVSGVEYEQVDVLDLDDQGAVRIDAQWLVRGVVRHQAHKHPRINRYRAVYTLADTPEGLRIVDTHMRDLARVATRVSNDALFDEDAGSGADEGFMDPLEMFEGGLFDEAPP